MEGEERRQRVSLAEARQARAGRPAAAKAYQAARLRFELAETSPRSRMRSPGTAPRQSTSAAWDETSPIGRRN